MQNYHFSRSQNRSRNQDPLLVHECQNNARVAGQYCSALPKTVPKNGPTILFFVVSCGNILYDTEWHGRWISTKSSGIMQQTSTGSNVLFTNYSLQGVLQLFTVNNGIFLLFCFLISWFINFAELQVQITSTTLTLTNSNYKQQLQVTITSARFMFQNVPAVRGFVLVKLRRYDCP